MYTKDKIQTYEDGIKNKWLLTNGIGGFSCSTIIGANTSKYDSLLTAALDKSRERFLVLSKTNEIIEINKENYSLSANECPNYIETGYEHQKKFTKQYLPEYEYEIKEIKITKKISLINKKNQIIIEYKIQNNAKANATLKILPLVNFRDYHSTKNAHNYEQAQSENVVRLKLSDKYNLYMRLDGAEYIEHEKMFYENMLYREDKERGLDHIETHNIPGEYVVKIKANENKKIYFIAEVNENCEINNIQNAETLIKAEEIRMQKLCKISNAKTDIQKELTLSADNFIIEKNNGKTIIAGYPWFSDWGRDAFIALEGITLKTNRYNDAKEIIKYFTKYIQNGLVPNYITEQGGEAYNSVDASLWYIEAVYQYIKITDDIEFLKEIYSKIKEIITSYQEGTLYNIHMDKDGLIIAGNETTQLTWMDAKIGNYIPTPRYGKAVEINALWYNALKITEKFSEILKEDFNQELSKKVKESYKKFYADEGLLDTIEPFNSDIRPNQLMAIGLTFPVVTGEKAKEILNLVEEKLLTNKGIKTLSSDNKNYKQRYEGGVFERDTSYHQGTVWPWLLKIYYKACENIKQPPTIQNNIQKMLEDNCIGNIAEIYDAEEPRIAKGAYAQAWSTAALLEIKEK